MLKESGVQAFLLGRGDQPAFAAYLAEPTGRCGAKID
jgi:hypothetical protein